MTNAVQDLLNHGFKLGDFSIKSSVFFSGCFTLQWPAQQPCSKFSTLNIGSSGPGSNHDRVTAFCSLVGHLTVTVALFTLEGHRWVPENCRGHPLLRWTIIPSNGGSNTPCRFKLQKPGIGRGCHGPVGLKGFTWSFHFNFILP